MRATWRLATSSFSGRRLRFSLLTGAVTMATSLVVAIACAIASLNAAMELRVASSVGAADVRLTHVGGRTFDRAEAAAIETWPAVDLAAPTLEAPLPLRNPKLGENAVAAGRGVIPSVEYQLRPLRLLEGRPVERPGEVVLEEPLVERLGAALGDEINLLRFGAPMRFTLVGVAAPQPLAVLARPEAILTLEDLGEASGEAGRISEIAIALSGGTDVERFIDRRQSELPEGLVLKASERITSGLDRNLRSSQLGLTLMSVLTFIAAAFIILTGLTTNVIERQRELAIVRCIGGGRAQVAAAQLLIGAIIGLSGAALGAPLGVAIAWVASIVFEEQLPAGLAISWMGVSLATAGSLIAGLAGAAWPAIASARVAPLRALAARAHVTPRWAVPMAALVGAALVALQPILVTAPDDPQMAFWLHVVLGAPAMFIGYFLLAALGVIIVAALLAPPLSLALRLPRRMLRRSAFASPFRFGFTAGSLMAGLALMTAIWTEGSALLRDWIGAIEFPEAFVHALRGLDPEERARVEALPFVEETVAISVMSIEEELFGVRALQGVGTNFIAFEPDPFFAMTKLAWIEGEPEYAIRRLKEGGAVLVAREFKIARGVSAGDDFTITDASGEEHTFEVVGVVTSPGLDIASRYFDIGREYTRQSIHAIMGSRQDMIDRFGNDVIHLLQIDLADDVDDEQALVEIRRALGSTMLTAGSGREIKSVISKIGRSSMKVMSAVALVAILIACFGVGQVVVASIDARRFEFGVLRAVGAEGHLLTRLIIGEVLIIAFVASALGSALGLHGAWTGLLMYRNLAGLNLSLVPPLGAIGAGWAILFTMTLAAAAPAALRLSRRSPRELLSATRG